MKILISLLAIGLMFLMTTGCQKQSPEAQQAQAAADSLAQQQPTEEIEAVCVWEGTTLRSIPNVKGRYISSISLGEKVIWLGRTVTDSSTSRQVNYTLLRLSDGSEGWANAYGIVRDAHAGVVTQKANIYRRPDLLTVTDKYFDPMDMVAITKVEGDWVEVSGNQRRKSGWIHAAGMSTNASDVAVAVLASKAFEIRDDAARNEKLQTIINNPQLETSVFITVLRNMMSPNPTPDELEMEEMNSSEGISR